MGDDSCSRCFVLPTKSSPSYSTDMSHLEDATRSSSLLHESNVSCVSFFNKVFYGCVRYKDAIRVFLKHYYNDMAGIVLRSDFTLYMILAYLLLFRLDEMGFDDFRHLTRPEDPTKIAHLLKYLTDWHRVEVCSCHATTRRSCCSYRPLPQVSKQPPRDSQALCTCMNNSAETCRCLPRHRRVKHLLRLHKLHAWR